MTLEERFKFIFERELIDEIRENGRVMEFAKGDVVMTYGKTVRIMPIILTGNLKVSRKDDAGHELLLYYLSPNESCAMTFTCCMENHPSEVKAVAETDLELLAVPTSIMDDWMAKYPSWKSFVMKTMRARFDELLRSIDHLAFENLDQRLIHYLKEKSEATGSKALQISHGEIAADLATSRVVVSRLLKKLELDKKVLLYRNEIKLLNAM